MIFCLIFLFYCHCFYSCCYCYKKILNFFDIFSVEIQELQAKLKAGYMNRERAAQLAERQVMELEKQVTYHSLKSLIPCFNLLKTSFSTAKRR